MGSVQSMSSPTGVCSLSSRNTSVSVSGEATSIDSGEATSYKNSQMPPIESNKVEQEMEYNESNIIS